MGQRWTKMGLEQDKLGTKFALKQTKSRLKPNVCVSKNDLKKAAQGLREKFCPPLNIPKKKIKTVLQAHNGKLC